jgi:hypothetical protein
LLCAPGAPFNGEPQEEAPVGDLRRAVRGQLNFTGEQAAVIRANLLTRPGSESAGTIH